MTKLTKRQKYIKEKYFKLVSHDPRHYAPISDESMKLHPYNLMRIIDLIIKVLEEEWDGEKIWVKIT